MPVAAQPGRGDCISLGDLLRFTLGDDMSASVTCPRPHIDQIVNRTDDQQVVLDDDDRIALVTQLFQGQ